MTEHPTFDLDAQARKAAKAMIDRDPDMDRITNPPEVDVLPAPEYKAYMDLMIVYMRELRSQSIPVSRDLEEGKEVQIK